MSDQPADPVPGKPAPLFCLPDADGTTVCLKDFTGTWVVVYFYPRDNTPGCTIEARGFSDAVDEFAALGAEIIGVSADTIDSHKKFAEKQNLRFRILSDESHDVLRSYGVWKEGKILTGIERSTFLVNPGGTIAAVWRKVNVFRHVGEVKKKLEEVTGTT